MSSGLRGFLRDVFDYLLLTFDCTATWCPNYAVAMREASQYQNIYCLHGWISCSPQSNEAGISTAVLNLGNRK